MDNGGCEHTCVNTNDGFFCTCEQGFTLESGKYCEGKISKHALLKRDQRQMDICNMYHVFLCKSL